MQTKWLDDDSSNPRDWGRWIELRARSSVWAFERLAVETCCWETYSVERHKCLPVDNKAFGVEVENGIEAKIKTRHKFSVNEEGVRVAQKSKINDGESDSRKFIVILKVRQDEVVGDAVWT